MGHQPRVFVRSESGIDRLLADAPTRHGNSGSPLVTLDGEVVGLVSGGTTTMGEESEPVVRSNEVFEEYRRSGVNIEFDGECQ